MKIPSSTRVGTAAAAWWLLSLSAPAQTAPRLEAVSPPIVRRGATTEVTLTGDRLAGVQGAHIAGEPGVTAAIDAAGRSAKKLRVRVSVAADAPLGERELRAVAPDGASNPLVLDVATLPVVLEKEPNNTPEQAQAIELPAVIVGQIHAPLEVDRFRFRAVKGSHLIAEVFASRMGGKLDGSLALNDAAGLEVARDEDARGPDPLLEYDVPADGEYVLSLRDYLYQGAPNEYGYRIEVGALPVIESFYPLGGPRGRPVEVALTGHNLDGAATTAVHLDPKAAVGRREVRVDTPFGPSHPLPFDVGDLPEVEDAEPNNVPDKAQVVSVPVIINGRMDAAGDVDMFRFKADPQTDLVLEVVASRFGSPLDALLGLLDAQGKPLQFNDDAAGMDARIEAKQLAKGGEYIVSVRDIIERGGKSFAYRLSIQPPRPEPPGFAVRFLPDTLRVGRGGHERVWCEVTRQGGYAGDVTVAFAGLPPGIACEPVAMPGKTPISGLFTIAAAPDAPTGTVPVRLVATGAVGDETRTFDATPEMDGRVARQAFVTVLDAPLFTIEPMGSASEAERKAKQEELAKLEKALVTQTREVDAAQAEWERRMATQGSWTVLVPGKFNASTGSALSKQEDGSILVGGGTPSKDTFFVTCRTDLKGITAFRLETLNDPSLPATGPGRAPNGNFVLTEFRVQSVPSSQALPEAPAAGAPGGAAPPAAEAGARPIVLHKASADHAQDGFPIDNAIDGKNDTGWAILPQTGVPHAAIFETKEPLGTNENGLALTFTLEQVSTYGQHLIGRFRLSATTARNPAGGAVTLTANIRTLLSTPPKRRTDAQKAELSTYYRSIAPELQPLRHQAARLRAETAEFPPQGAKEKPFTVGVAVRRREDFAGKVALSLQGFSSGRDPQSRQPTAISKNLDAKPLSLEPDQMFGVLELTPKSDSEGGSRAVVIKGVALVKGETIAQYSRAFPLTIHLLRPIGPPRNPDDPPDLLKGLDVAYYEGAWTQLPDFAALKAVHTGAAEAFDIAPRKANDHFGFVFSGYLDAPRDGAYTFILKSDDGSRLKIGSKVVVDHDGLHGPTDKSGAIELKAGKHAIEVSFFEGEGGESLEVLWEGPGIGRQPIPAGALFRVRQDEP